MQSFNDFKQYILSNCSHAPTNERREVHIILPYEKLEFGEFYKHLMGLTWWSGMRWLNSYIHKRNSVIFAETLDEALQQANNFDYAMVSYVGTVYRQPSRPELDIWDYFQQWKENESEDSPCKGHILWHPGKMYGHLHLQCMFINLKHWRSMGCPTLGRWSGLAHKPEVCSENIHDDYTPLWIKPSLTKQITYVRNYPMAEYISKLLDDGKQIINFTPIERTTKYFTYPWREEKSPQLIEDENMSSNILYRKNTTGFKSLNRIANKYGVKKYDVIYSTASGGIGEFLWHKLGHPETKLVFLDNHEPSILWKQVHYGHYGNPVKTIDDLDRITDIVAKKHDCFVDRADYKNKDFHDAYNSIWSDQQWVDTISKITNWDAQVFDYLENTLDVDSTKRNFVYLTNIFAYRFNYFKYNLEYLNNKFQHLIQQPNTTIVGANPFGLLVQQYNHDD